MEGQRARAAQPSRRQSQDAELLEQILKVRASNEFAATYGSPRVWLELKRQGVRRDRKRIEWIMRENRLAGAYLRKGWKGGSTRQNPKRHLTWWNATSPRASRTGCGWRT